VDARTHDGAAVRIPPPLVYLAAVGVGAALHAWLLPLRLGLGTGPRIAVAGLAAGVGIALMAGAFGHFRRTGQDPKPWLATPEIISGGVYRYTRNPMYVSMALLQVAIGVGLANGWILLLVPVVGVVVQRTAIRHEEAYLERKFGDAYTAYKQSVRRWI
jgi:protein-S-isoprenylcysteine O-methyltransferase Ste14